MMRAAKWQTLSWLAQLLLCGWMAFGSKPQAHADQGTDIAVLQNRDNQIDAHLQSTDGQVSQLWTLVRDQGNQLSEMEGEERAAFAVLTLLTASNFVVQVSGRKKSSG